MNQTMTVGFNKEPIVTFTIDPDWIEVPFNEPLTLTIVLSQDAQDAGVTLAATPVFWRGNVPTGSTLTRDDDVTATVRLPSLNPGFGGVAHGFFVMVSYEGLNFSSPDPTIVTGTGTGQTP